MQLDTCRRNYLIIAHVARRLVIGHFAALCFSLKSFTLIVHLVVKPGSVAVLVKCVGIIQADYTASRRRRAILAFNAE